MDLAMPQPRLTRTEAAAMIAKRTAPQPTLARKFSVSAGPTSEHLTSPLTVSMELQKRRSAQR